METFFISKGKAQIYDSIPEVKRHALSNELIKPFPQILEYGKQKFDKIFLNSLNFHYNKGFEFCFVHKGRYQWVVEGQEFTLYPGDTFITCPWELHGSKGGVLDLGILSWLIIHPGYLADTSDLEDPAPVDAYTLLRYGDPFSYVFPDLTPDSSYVVRLHFADDWDEANKRVQDVSINGVQVLFDFDIFEEAGKMVATISQFNSIADSEGKIVIEFSATVDNALISAIEIIRGSIEITGITERLSIDTFKSTVYPNPLSGDILTVRMGESSRNSYLQIIDMGGRLIFERKFPNDIYEMKIDRQVFQPGQYIIYIRSSKGVAAHKLIVL